MSTLAQRLVDEARTWKGTSFLHQGRLKGLGVDCAGFIGEVARNVGIPVDIPSDYKPQEDGTVMMRLMSQHLDFIETKDAQPGDVLALSEETGRAPDVPRHLAFVTEVTEKTAFIIHASRHGVREHRMDSAWNRRVHSAWRIKADAKPLSHSEALDNALREVLAPRND